MFDSRWTEVEEGLVLIFATQKNIELLCRSSIWVLDRTFKVSPTIFSQLFTIIGLRNSTQAERKDTPLPFRTCSCPVRNRSSTRHFCKLVKNAVAHYQLPHCVTQKIMTDFEKGIINTTQELFPKIQVACCFFHLGQSVYRQVQDKGLQQAYNNPDERGIKTFIHKLLALAYQRCCPKRANLTF